jgi:hypothetical protein
MSTRRSLYLPIWIVQHCKLYWRPGVCDMWRQRVVEQRCVCIGVNPHVQYDPVAIDENMCASMGHEASGRDPTSPDRLCVEGVHISRVVLMCPS